MWVMTPRGFFSVVQHRDEPTNVMVRARCEDDIRALSDLLPDAEPVNTPRADYAWRLVVPAVEWASAVTQMALEVDYNNFKNAVTDEKHHDAYMGVWSTLLRLDDRHNEWYGDDAHWATLWQEEEEDEEGDAEEGDVLFMPKRDEKEHDRTLPFFDPPGAAA